MVSNICIYIIHIYIFIIGNYRRLWLWLWHSTRLDGLLWWIMMQHFEENVLSDEGRQFHSKLTPNACSTFCFLVFVCLMTLGWRGRAFLFAFWWLIHSSSSFGSHISSFPHITGTLTGLTNRRYCGVTSSWKASIQSCMLWCTVYVISICICILMLHIYTPAGLTNIHWKGTHSPKGKYSSNFQPLQIFWGTGVLFHQQLCPSKSRPFWKQQPWSQALPEYYNAIKALDSLDKKDIQEANLDRQSEVDFVVVCCVAKLRLENDPNAIQWWCHYF